MTTNGWLFLSSLYTYSLSTRYVPVTVLGLGTAGSGGEKAPYPPGA